MQRYLRLSLFLFLTVWTGGCKSSSSTLECIQNSDCSNDAVCINGHCEGRGLLECQTNADCGDHNFCINGICEGGGLLECATNDDCDPNAICLNGFCEGRGLLECETSEDCGPGNFCVNGFCEGGGLLECTCNEDCGEDMFCINGFCEGKGLLECETSADCGKGNFCIKGKCHGGGLLGATFTALPFTNEEYLDCGVNGMNEEAAILAGTCMGTNGEMEAVVWIRQNGQYMVQNLGHIGPHEEVLPQNTFAYGASSNGVVIANEGYGNLLPLAYYLQAETWQPIVNPQTQTHAMTAQGISKEGTVIIGNTSDDKDGEVYHGGYAYEPASGRYDLFTSSFFADVCDSYKNCGVMFNSVTSDGQAAVGVDTYSPSSDLNGSLFLNNFPIFIKRMTGEWGSGLESPEEIKMIPVYYTLDISVAPVRLAIPDSYPQGAASRIARDGSAIVGAARGNLMPTIAIYWDSNFVVHVLGSLGPDTEWQDTMAYDTCNGGTRIVGRSNGQAFIYTQEDGLMRLADYLTLIGLGDQIADWDFDVANSISADGHYIAGTGRFQHSYNRGFIVYIP